jgi:glucosamine--fructose-6-phosphate aminotransferase (isomerizing)
MEKSLNSEAVDTIKKISSETSRAGHLLYIGRNIFYPLALEGALKIKETSYIPTHGYASGELKHGPIALVDADTFVVVLNNSGLLCDKNISSIEEIAARNGKIILICDKLDKVKDKIYTNIETSTVEDKIEVALTIIPMIQLLAYYTALERGLDIDKPRNLAKSVTVE